MSLSSLRSSHRPPPPRRSPLFPYTTLFRSVIADGSPARLRGTQDSDLRLELQLRADRADPSEEDLELPVLRRVRTGRRTLLTVSANEAATAVAWATGQRAEGRIDGFSLAPATLEDAYLAFTTPTDSASGAGIATAPTSEETTHV